MRLLLRINLLFQTRLHYGGCPTCKNNSLMMVQLHNSMMVRNIESYLELDFRRETFSFLKRIAHIDKLLYRFQCPDCRGRSHLQTPRSASQSPGQIVQYNAATGGFYYSILVGLAHQSAAAPILISTLISKKNYLQYHLWS